MNKFIVIVMLMLTGCTATIVDRDFEKEEKDFIKKHGVEAKDPLYAPATPEYVLAGYSEHVLVSLYKGPSEKQDKIELQVWNATAVNHNDKPVCLMVHWKLMDFSLVTDYGDFTYLKPEQQILKYATMKQQVWNLDGTQFALPPSGYIDNMIIKEPIKDAKPGYECEFDTIVHEE